MYSTSTFYSDVGCLIYITSPIRGYCKSSAEIVTVAVHSVSDNRFDIYEYMIQPSTTIGNKQPNNSYCKYLNTYPNPNTQIPIPILP